MRRIQAVVFDLDDTLYPERAYAFGGFDAVAEAFADVLGDPHASAQRMKALFDTEHRRQVFDQILAERGSLESAAGMVAKMVDTFRAHHPRIKLPPESVRVLTGLGASFRLGLITDGPADTQRAKINALGFVERSVAPTPPGRTDRAPGIVLDAIVVTDELGPGFGKPHARAFELIATRLAVSPEACVYVADNVAKDFIAPNALGWLTVRVVRPNGVYVNARTAKDGDPHVTIATLDALPALLDFSASR